MAVGFSENRLRIRLCFKRAKTLSLSSCADVFRASTCASAQKEHVDGRDKPNKSAHDDNRWIERIGLRRSGRRRSGAAFIVTKK